MGMVHCFRGSPKNGRNRIVIPWEPIEERDKWCPRCRQFLPLNSFYPNHYKVYGLSDKCKTCDNAYRRKKREKSNKRGGDKLC